MATLEELINRMYDMVQDAKGIPLAGEKCIVERDHMLDMLDELREALRTICSRHRKLLQSAVRCWHPASARLRRSAVRLRRMHARWSPRPRLS